MAITINSPEAQTIIAAVEKSLVEMSLYDIHRSLRRRPPVELVNRKTKLEAGRDAIGSSFILGCCLIEAAGHFLIQPPPPPAWRPGGGWKRPDSKSKEAFEAFCSEFMKAYNGQILYQATRCGLAHAYTPASNDPNVREAYWLTHNETAAHLQSDIGDPRIRYINAQDFITDLHDGIIDFFDAVKNDRTLPLSGVSPQETFLKWAEYSGFMAVPSNTRTGTAATVATAAAAAPIWNGSIPSPVNTPVLGIGTRLVANSKAPSGALSAIDVPATGWCGVSDLGVIGGYCLVTSFNQSSTVKPPPGFQALPRILPTGKPSKKARGKGRRR